MVLSWEVGCPIRVCTWTARGRPVDRSLPAATMPVPVLSQGPTLIASMRLGPAYDDMQIPLKRQLDARKVTRSDSGG